LPADERIWTLNKDEAMAVKRYFSSLADIWDEINVIILEKWKDIEKDYLLTKSMLRRLSSFYYVSYKFAEKVGDRDLGTITGPYFEDIIFSPLETFIRHQLKGASLKRSKAIKDVGVKPDISVYVQDIPFYAIEVKVWMDKPQIDEVERRRAKLKEKNIELACVTSWLYSKKRDELKNKEWMYMLSSVPVEKLSRYEPQIERPIEELFNATLEKARTIK